MCCNAHKSKRLELDYFTFWHGIITLPVEIIPSKDTGLGMCWAQKFLHNGMALKLDVVFVIPVGFLPVLFFVGYLFVLWQGGQFSQYADNFAEHLLMIAAHIDAQINLTEIVVIQLAIEYRLFEKCMECCLQLSDTGLFR